VGIDENREQSYALCTANPMTQMKLNQRIRAARLTLGESLPVFARRFGVHPMTIWKWENLNQTPGGPAQRLLAQLFAEMTPSRTHHPAE
jgi:DNA-binding transcriptional regulator YiaG